MSKWIDANHNERLLMLQKVAEEKGFVNSAAEKDWWVSLALKALFSLPCAPYLLFKGGTSLSKGWNLIKRFSEDIDLTISQRYFQDVLQLPFAGCANNQQIKKLRMASRDFIVDELCQKLEIAIRNLGIEEFTLKPVTTVEKTDGTFAPIDHDSDPTTLQLTYQSIVKQKFDYVTPVVKIEISCLGMDEPYENRRISSLIADFFPEEDDELVMTIPTVLPTRTFLEKAFLLNEEFQRREPRYMRMSRHLYDLEKLMDTSFAADALRNMQLYEQIVAHRKRFYHVGGVEYEKDMPQSINFLPSGSLNDRFRADYTEMLNTYIYEKETAPSYDFVIMRLAELRSRFNNIHSQF